MKSFFNKQNREVVVTLSESEILRLLASLRSEVLHLDNSFFHMKNELRMRVNRCKYYNTIRLVDSFYNASKFFCYE